MISAAVSSWSWFCRKAKWLSEEALQIAVKREKERYTHLNTEFQRTARRDKKTFLSDQWKEIEENKGMGKTRDLLMASLVAQRLKCLPGMWETKV